MDLKDNLIVRPKIKTILEIHNRKNDLSYDLPFVKPFLSINNPLSLPVKLQPNNNKDTKTQLIFQKNYKTKSK